MSARVKMYRESGAGPLHWCGFALALATGLMIAAQLAYLLTQGAPYCPSEGCRIVDERSPLPQWMMNGGGLAFFALLSLLFAAGGRRDGAARALIGPLALAAVAAEGVLFAFQYQTGAFCLYCCAILAALALINLCLGGRQFLRAIGVFAATALAALVFTVPGNGAAAGSQVAAVSGIEAGVMARRDGPAGAERRYLFFSKDCAHCKAALAALLEDENAGLRLNPIDRPEGLALPEGMETAAEFSPEANRAFLKDLGVEAVPVLLARQADGGMRLILGDRKIIAHIEADKAKAEAKPETPPAPAQPTAPATPPPTAPAQSSQSSQSQKSPADEFLNPGDSCNLNVGCAQ